MLRIEENAQTLKRRVFYDIIPKDILSTRATQLGLAPAHPDVDEAENRASLARKTNLEALLPFIAALSGLSSEACRAAILVARGDEDLLPPEFAVLMLASNLSVVANLVDLGALHINPAVYGEPS